MTKTNTYGFYAVDSTTCSSRIYNGDFDNYQSMSDIASRIASDFKFDEQCRKNVDARMRGRK